MELRDWVAKYAATVQIFVSSPYEATDPYQGGLLSKQRVASYADLVTAYFTGRYPLQHRLFLLRGAA